MPRWSAFHLLCLLLPTSASAWLGISDAHAQKEVAVVRKMVDLNGDGKKDELRIDDLGTISILIAGDESAGAWTPLAAQGKLIGGSFAVSHNIDPSGKPLILAIAKLRRGKTRTYEEALVLSYSSGSLKTLWRGPQGNAVEDGALRMFIELNSFGLIRYASRQGVFRCDGKTAHLDAKRYDFATHRFRPAGQAIRIPKASPVLVASATAPSEQLRQAKGYLFRPRGASTSLRASRSSQLVAPLEIADQNNSTAWVENKSGFGRGEFVTLQSDLGPAHIQALRIVTGHGDALSEYNRPKRLGLLLDKRAYWVDIKQDRPGKETWIVLPEPVLAQCVSLVIADVFPQSASKRNRGRTAISEVSVLSSEELDPVRSAEYVAKNIAAGRAKADTQRLLSSLGVKAAVALSAAIEAASPRGKSRLRLALATLPANPEQLVEGIQDEHLRSRDHLVLTRALHKLGAASIPPLLRALQSPSSGKEAKKRVALVLQTATGKDAQDALLSALGKGAPAMRLILVTALGKKPKITSAITEALEAADGNRRIDLLRSLAIAGARLDENNPERATIDTLFRSAFASPSLSYESRYRLLSALGDLGGSDAFSLLSSEFSKLRPLSDAQSLALSEISAAAMARLAQSPEQLSLPLQEGAPGVRLAILSNLNSQASLSKSLLPLLQSDPWPEIRRKTAALLGAHCEDPTIANALTKAVRTDSDSQVTITSLTAILSCAPNGVFGLLLYLTNKKDRPLSLRLLAARNLANPENHPDASIVRKRFQRARRQALSNKNQAKIASALTVALARIGGPKSVALLESTAADPAFPQLQTAALVALSESCPKSSLSLFRKLKNAHEHSVSRAASRALNRCR